MSCITVCFTYFLRMAIFFQHRYFTRKCSDTFRVWWSIYISLRYKFSVESNSERILKIGKYLVKLLARVRCLVFFDSPCILWTASDRVYAFCVRPYFPHDIAVLSYWSVYRASLAGVYTLLAKHLIDRKLQQVRASTGDDVAARVCSSYYCRQY